MTKKALLEEAQELGLEVTEKDTKAEIQRRLYEVATNEAIKKVLTPTELNKMGCIFCQSFVDDQRPYINSDLTHNHALAI